MKDDKPLNCGVRQVAPTPDGIKHNHVVRYNWASEQIGDHASVLDVGCGCGYGASVLRHTQYLGVDYSQESIDYARKHYGKFGLFSVGDAIEVGGPLDVIVAFEVIEHVVDPTEALRAWHEALFPLGELFISIPIKCRKVADGHEYHLKDYTEQTISDALEAAGFTIGDVRYLSTKDTIVERDKNPYSVLIRAFK